MDPQGAFEALRASLDGRLARSAQPAPFAGAPSSTTWLLTWTSDGAPARLQGSRVEIDGARTDSSWFAFEAPALDPRAWLRVATRAFASMALGDRVPHRRMIFAVPALDGAIAQGVAPGPEEWTALNGPYEPPQSLEEAMRASDDLAKRLRAPFTAVLPKLRELGEFVIEVEDGTMSVRFPSLFGEADAYRRVIDATRTLLAAAPAPGGGVS
jgi:hypothetical protein